MNEFINRNNYFIKNMRKCDIVLLYYAVFHHSKVVLVISKDM